MATRAPHQSPQGKVGYDVLRECHKKAYAYLSEALRIDENGVGDKNKNAALDYYSKGVTELERGVSYDVEAQGDDLEKAESLKKKMISNLDMARDRVTVLLDGGALKGSKKQTKDSMAKNNFQASRKNAPGQGKGKHGIVAPSRNKKLSPGQAAQLETDPRKKEKSVPVVKGVDENLVQIVMNDLLDREAAITWNDVVGLELPKRVLQEIVILPTLRPELFTGLRAPARGLLLFGPPGNGKTMLAKAVAHESNASFFNASASTLTSKWVGEGEKLVKALFAVARVHQPSVIFLDEVDALLSERGKSEHDSMRRLKNEFLMAFDGMSSTEGERILVLAATNRPHELDDAALRRFEKRIYIPLPSFEARKSVLHKLLSKHKNNITAGQLEDIARLCEGYSSSDLTALAKDAALGPIREVDYETLCQMPANRIRPMTTDDFQRSMHTIRPSVSPDMTKILEKWNASYGVSA